MEASQSTTAEAGGNDADEDTPKEIACFYNGAGQEVPKNATKLIVGPDVVGIDEGAFEGYESLKEVDMSKALSLRIIAMRAFYNCSALVLIKWPPNLKTIGDRAFARCASLKEADISKLLALETIGQCAFSDCSALATVKLSPNLKTIGGRAFYACTSLEEADMSQVHVLEFIRGHAFARCSALVIVKWATNIKTIGRGAFHGCPVQHVVIPLRHHWFVRKLRFDGRFDETQLQSVDMQGNDLKKAIRIKNLYPRATPRLTMDRLVSMYAKSPLTADQLENIARRDESVTEEDWAEVRLGDLERLEGIQRAYAGSVFNLLH